MVIKLISNPQSFLRKVFEESEENPREYISRLVLTYAVMLDQWSRKVRAEKSGNNGHKTRCYCAGAEIPYEEKLKANYEKIHFWGMKNGRKKCSSMNFFFHQHAHALFFSPFHHPTHTHSYFYVERCWLKRVDDDTIPAPTSIRWNEWK